MGEKQMSVVITLEDIQAYAEVDYIINHMNEKYIAKVPEKLLDFFSNMKDPNYEVYIDPRKPLQDQGLKKYTLEIIALLHVKYWCEDEARRNELIEKMESNQEFYENKLKEQFNVDKLFSEPTAKKISSLDDLEEKEDHSKPKAVKKVIVNKEKEEKEDKEKYPQKVEKKVSIFAKIKQFFSSKKKDKKK